MIETFIKDKLYRACTVSVLTSGTKVISIATRPNEYFVTMSFPHTFEGDTLVPYLPEADTRNIDVMAYQVVIAKKVSREVADKFFMQVLTNELSEFSKFVEDFTIGLASTAEEAGTTDTRVLH